MPFNKDYTCFDVDMTDKVATLTLKRPDDLNTMTRDFWYELPEIVNALSEEGEARAIILASTGRHFTAGMDLGVFTGGGSAPKDLNTSKEIGRQRANFWVQVNRIQTAISCLEKARMPVLAAVQGGCIGGGIDLITAADMRYCTKDAFFTVMETNIGMTADVGTLQRLPKVIPEGMAREMAYTGRRVSAEEALRCGLVNSVYYDQETMLAEVRKLALQIAGNAPLAVWGCKEMINYARDHTVADSLNYIAVWQSGMYHPQGDMAEAFKARAEKRPGDFDDLIPLPKTYI